MMTERWLDQKRMELLEELASGAQAEANESGELILANKGKRQQTRYGASDLVFLEEIGFAQHLAVGDAYFPVVVTRYGKQYVEESYWINGWRIGRLRDGRTAIGMPEWPVDVPTLTPGIVGNEEAGRLLLAALKLRCP